MLSRGKKFEVAIHNKDVRRLVREGERHRELKDTWGDTQYLMVTAKDVADARRKMLDRYPESRGFVIENVMLADE
jgi:hypothetical protein